MFATRYVVTTLDRSLKVPTKAKQTTREQKTLKEVDEYTHNVMFYMLKREYVLCKRRQETRRSSPVRVNLMLLTNKRQKTLVLAGVWGCTDPSCITCAIIYIYNKVHTKNTPSTC